tara:strand:- start:88 stop:981 length:894 start_codon:yes stop_codon:yes gene_type:complete
MSSKKFTLLVNPQGGTKRGLDILNEVRPIFEKSGAELDVRKTEYAGHATELARESDLNGITGLCHIGGDGTFHEIINGLLTRHDGKQVPLGYIPGGTGNSFMYDIDCLDPADAAERIINGHTTAVDVAEVQMPNEKVYCMNIVGWGMVTDINKSAEKVRWLGEQRYNVTTLLNVMKLKQRPAKLMIDGEEIEDDFLFTIACNTKHTGRGMKMAPKSELNDGLIDLVLVRGAGRLKLLRMFPKVFDGSHINDPIVEYHQVRSFSVAPMEDEILNLDGELKGSTPFSVRVIPSAFLVFM